MVTHFDGSRRDAAATIVVGLGASAGGIEAISELLEALPPTFGGSVIVVLHITAVGADVLPGVLARASRLPVLVPQDFEVLREGTVYVAPHDRQLVVERRAIRLVDSPPVNGYRPAIDTLLASLSTFDGPAVGVVLSGTLDDGSRGLQRLKEAGGTAIVQDPDEAQHRGMIVSAQKAVAVDATLPVSEIARTLVGLDSRRRRAAS
jgi:two-component system chemotaxis response regulator CheB